MEEVKEMKENAEKVNNNSDEKKQEEKELKREFLQQYGKPWTKYGKDRVYFNKSVFKLVGLEVKYYETGNISASKLGGEEISHSRAARILDTLDGCYYDFDTQQVSAKHREDKEILELLQEKLEEAYRATEVEV